MNDENIDEQQITEVTGHKSVAVHKYKRMSMEKQKEMSGVLYGKTKKEAYVNNLITTRKFLWFGCQQSNGTDEERNAGQYTTCEHDSPKSRN